MLGQQIGDERGKVTARRVLPSDGQGPKMEVTFEAKGHFVGIESVDVGTYWTVVQSNGLLYGEGEGFITTNQGDVVQWTGSGRGRLTPHGGASFRGAIYYLLSRPCRKVRPRERGRRCLRARDRPTWERHHERLGMEIVA